MATGQDLLRLDEAPGTGVVASDFQVFGKDPRVPGKEFRVPASRLPGGGAPVASLTYTIDEAKDKRDNGQLPDGRPTAAIPDVWNGAGDSVVYLQVEESNRWAKYGQLLDAQGKWSFVEVDLDSATTTVHGGQLNRLIARTDILKLLNPNPGLTPGGYIVKGWNGNPDLAVSMYASTRGTLSPLGTIAIGNGAQLVVCDVQAGTYKTFAELLAGASAEALHFVYTVQGADVTNPATPITIAVPGARGFGVVGVRKVGSLDFTPIAPGTQYTTGAEQVTVAVLTPPLVADDQVIIYYVTGVVGGGAGYTKAEADARFVPLAVPVGTGSPVTFDLERDWPPINTGTYVVDATGAEAKVCFQLVLAYGCTEIQIPQTGFVKVSPGVFDSSTENTYWFCVRVDGKVQYAITQPN